MLKFYEDFVFKAYSHYQNGEYLVLIMDQELDEIYARFRYNISLDYIYDIVIKSSSRNLINSILDTIDKCKKELEYEK